jgi:hypothetical protein
MAALKPLLDAECGTTNPLIKLSQFYTRDNTLVTQVNYLVFYYYYFILIFLFRMVLLNQLQIIFLYKHLNYSFFFMNIFFSSIECESNWRE